MVEVFKTNVEDYDHASLLVEEIQRSFNGYLANFDLEDCDRILRVRGEGIVEAQPVISLLNQLGYDAQVLPDEVPSFTI